MPALQLQYIRGVLLRSQRFTCIAAGLLACCICQISYAIPIPAPPQLNARSYILMDANSGQVIAASNPDMHSEPASLTKLMTAFVVFHALKDHVIQLDEPVTISAKAWRMGGSRMFANVGSKVSVDDLLQGMIVQSGNDAAVALAEKVGGTEGTFVELMNKYAQELGLRDTHYVDASGLTNNPEHYVSARDLAILSRAIITEFPDYYHKFFAEKEFTWDKITQQNRVSLLFTDPGVDGLKTGYTEKAGYCMVVSALRNNTRLIAVVMGTPSEKARAVDDEALLNYGFNFFEDHLLYAAGTEITKIRAWKGAGGYVPVGVTRDLYVTIPKGSYSQLHASQNTPAGLVAPISAGTVAGEIDVSLDGKSLVKAQLYALQAVPEGNIFRRMFDSIRLLFVKK
ncbi:MAG: D-alanyl-D-alanine carboxypeptidase [Gammaproteobacteria bacterium]|nr:D-alanyl-D-alanine carboxypeptidase [Gammaproteobacteria bacterium]MDE2345319.1 D-alanyl-D-alanine carboxypeptidase [Gammaproteobacteria bacterium]